MEFIKDWKILEFEQTYGIDTKQFILWENSSDSQKAEYKELELLYLAFCELYTEHYDDLKLYALMYRNVPLYNIYKDIYSMLYFGSRKDEIIGYKQLISKDRSGKANIVRLYSSNEALFPKICQKYIGVDFLNNKPGNTHFLTLHTLQDFKENKIPHILSVNDLSEEQCEILLQYEKNFQKEYFVSYNTGLKSSSEGFPFSSLTPYVKSSFIENYLNLVSGKYSSFVTSRINRFLNVECGYKNFRNDIKDIANHDIKLFYSAAMEVEELTKQFVSRSLKELPCRSIDKQLNLDIICDAHPSLYSDVEKKLHNRIGLLLREIDILTGKSKMMTVFTLEEKNILSNAAIIDFFDSLRNRIISVECELNNYKSKLIQYVSDKESFKLLYSNYVKANTFVEHSYEKAYNLMWLYRPQLMKELEAHTTSASSLRELMALYYRSFIHRAEKPKVLQPGSEKAFFMRKWCFLLSIQQKKKQAEEKRQEEEKRKIEEERKRKEEEVRIIKYGFNKRNKHYRDTHISFDEKKHTYIVNGLTLQSVTNVVANCFPKFNTELHAKKTASRMGITPQEVINMWEKKGQESRDLGTEMHKKIENYYLGNDSNVDDTFRLFMMFTKRFDLKPYRTEWAVYDIDHNIAGTIDFLDYQDGKYTIYDWKRSDKIIENGMPVKISKYQEKGLHPLENLENCAYYHYALQLSLYKFILEKNYDINVSELRLGIFHPTYDRPYVLKIPYLENEVNTLMALRSEVLL